MSINKMKCTTVIISLIAGLGMMANAQLVTWTGGGADNNWSTADNWSPALVPDGNTYTALVETASASINVDAPYTVKAIEVASNFYASASTVAFDGLGPLTIDINSGTTPGIRNLAEGDGTVLEFNCDLSIFNSFSTGGNGRTEVDIGSGTNNVVRFGTNCTLTTTSHILFNDDDGRVELNCTLLGSGTVLYYSENNYIGDGFDSSGFGSIIIPASGSSKMTFNGGTVSGSIIQANGGGSLATLVFNAENVFNNVELRGGGGFNLVANASQDNMGTLSFNSPSIIDPAGGTLTFADCSSETWGGDLTISTNFAPNDIRFGISSNALTDLQLLSTSADGIDGGAKLDEFGFLTFDAPPPVITGEDIVNCDPSSVGARLADTITSNGYTWAFSETVPLFDNPSGQSVIYGGMTMTWPTQTNEYVPELEIANGQIMAKVDPDFNADGTTIQGMYIWPKGEFLVGSDGTVSFTNGNSMLMKEKYMWGGVGGERLRFAAKQGGTYYVSDAAITSGGNDQTLLIDPSDPTVNWAPISTNDYSIGTYTPMTFTDVEAVGIYVAITHTESRSYVTISDFQTRASVVIPPASEISDIVSSFEGGQMILSWQGTNTANYTLQMREDLLFGSWSNVVEGITGTDDVMSVTNAADLPKAFFRTILAE